MSGAARRGRATLPAEQAETWFAYMRVVLRMDYEVNRELQLDAGLSHQDFHILNALADSPGQRLRLGDLAVRIGWERSRVSHQVLRMAGRGLVDRLPSATDARATDAALTADGRAALRRALPGHLALVRTMFFDGLDPELLEPLRRALEQIHDQVIAHGRCRRRRPDRTTGPRPDARRNAPRCSARKSLALRGARPVTARTSSVIQAASPSAIRANAWALRLGHGSAAGRRRAWPPDARQG